MNSSHFNSKAVMRELEFSAEIESELVSELMTCRQAVTLEKSNVTAKRHSSKLLPISLFLFPMTYMTFNIWESIYRNKKENGNICKFDFFIYIYRGNRKPMSSRHITSHPEQAFLSTGFPVASIDNNL